MTTIYNNGLAHISELLQNINSPNGQPQTYLESTAKRSIITSMTGMTPFDTWYSSVAPDMENTNVAINSLAPFRGMYHFFFGNGQTLNVNFDEIPLRIHISSVKISQLNDTAQPDKPLEQIIQELGIGTHSISLKFGYDTQHSAFGADFFLGRIALRFVGNITVRNDGSYLIDGEIKSFADQYNGGKSNRDTLREIFTWFLEKANGTEYQININGSQKINYDSATPSNTGERTIKTNNPSTIINGNNNFNTAYIYNKSDGYIIQKISETDAYIYGENSNYHAKNIDRISFEDIFFEISGMPVVPIGNGPKIIVGI